MKPLETKRRATRSDKGVKRGPNQDNQGKIAIEVTLRPGNIEYARGQVNTGEYRSVSDYIDSLIAMDEAKTKTL